MASLLENETIDELVERLLLDRLVVEQRVISSLQHLLTEGALPLEGAGELLQGDLRPTNGGYEAIGIVMKVGIDPPQGERDDQ